jgi:hypothetical protein
MIRYDGGEFYKKYLLKVDFEGKNFYYVTVSRMNQSLAKFKINQLKDLFKSIAVICVNEIEIVLI